MFNILKNIECIINSDDDQEILNNFWKCVCESLNSTGCRLQQGTSYNEQVFSMISFYVLKEWQSRIVYPEI